MYIEMINATITAYRTADSRSDLWTVLKLAPQAQEYVEVTSDGVLFVDSYLDTSQHIEITPPHDEEFGPADILDILSRSAGYFGEQCELEPLISGHLAGGIVFATVDDNGPVRLGETFEGIRREDWLPADDFRPSAVPPNFQ